MKQYLTHVSPNNKSKHYYTHTQQLLHDGLFLKEFYYEFLTSITPLKIKLFETDWLIILVITVQTGYVLI